MTSPPSPIHQETDCGVATAVALTGPTVAVIEYECQMPVPIHNQVGRFTTENAAGLNDTSGGGSRSEFSA